MTRSGAGRCATARQAWSGGVLAQPLLHQPAGRARSCFRRGKTALKGKFLAAGIPPGAVLEPPLENVQNDLQMLREPTALRQALFLHYACNTRGSPCPEGKTDVDESSFLLRGQRSINVFPNRVNAPRLH